jgi:hypothetical protein
MLAILYERSDSGFETPSAEISGVPAKKIGTVTAERS